MSIEIVTGYQGKNHVTSNDIGGFQQGVVGVEDYVLGVGEKAKATLISNNSVRISDGELVMQGVHWRIKPGTYENVTINNGSQGMRRKDAIIARYRKNSGTGVESIELAVLQGTPTYSTPTAPTPTTGNIRSGALKHEMILYVVELNGLNVVGVEPAFQVLMSMHEIKESLSVGSFATAGNNIGLSTKYRKLGALCEVAIDGIIERKGFTANSGYTIGTLPVGCRPAIMQKIQTTDSRLRIEIQTTGSVKVIASQDIRETQSEIRQSICYIA